MRGYLAQFNVLVGCTNPHSTAAITGTSLRAEERAVSTRGAGRVSVTGFNLDFGDLNADGRLDIVLTEASSRIVWLEQPTNPSLPWVLHAIGTVGPDSSTGFALADINGDGTDDLIVGGYSRGARDADGAVTVDDSLGRLAWFERRSGPAEVWVRHDISRRKRGMFDKFIARDFDRDGDVDFAGTRGNSVPYDGVFWLEQVRTREPAPSFTKARAHDSEEMPLPGRR
jgi:FG-GAP-like repeat